MPQIHWETFWTALAALVPVLIAVVSAIWVVGFKLLGRFATIGEQISGIQTKFADINTKFAGVDVKFANTMTFDDHDKICDRRTKGLSESIDRVAEAVRDTRAEVKENRSASDTNRGQVGDSLTALQIDIAGIKASVRAIELRPNTVVQVGKEHA